MDGLLKWFDPSCVLAVPTVPLHLVNRKDKYHLLVKASGQVLSSGALQGLLPWPGLCCKAADLFLQWTVSSLRTGAQHLWKNTWRGVCRSWTEGQLKSMGHGPCYTFCLLSYNFSVNTSCFLWLPRPSKICCPSHIFFWGSLSLC